MNLTDTHLVLLSRATQRDDGALDVPATLKGRQKIIGQLLAGKLVEEVLARGALPVWRRDDQAGSLALIITDAGLKAIRADAVEPHMKEKKPATATAPQKPVRRKKAAPAKASKKSRAAHGPASKKREGSKQIASSRRCGSRRARRSPPS